MRIRRAILKITCRIVYYVSFIALALPAFIIAPFRKRPRLFHIPVLKNGLHSCIQCGRIINRGNFREICTPARSIKPDTKAGVAACSKK